jgi:hypothetical protein
MRKRSLSLIADTASSESHPSSINLAAYLHCVDKCQHSAPLAACKSFHMEGSQEISHGGWQEIFSLLKGKRTCPGQFHQATPRPAIHRFPPAPSHPPIPQQPALSALDRCSVHLSLPLFRVKRPRPSHRGSGGLEAGEGKPGALWRPLEEERKAQR